MTKHKQVFVSVLKLHNKHHGIMASSNGNIFRVTGPLCGEFTGEFTSQRPVTRRFDVFVDLCLNKRLSKQSWGWWFQTPSRSLWRHCNGIPGILPLVFHVAPKLVQKLGYRTHQVYGVWAVTFSLLNMVITNVCPRKYQKKNVTTITNHSMEKSLWLSGDIKLGKHYFM